MFSCALVVAIAGCGAAGAQPVTRPHKQVKPTATALSGVSTVPTADTPSTPTITPTARPTTTRASVTPTPKPVVVLAPTVLSATVRPGTVAPGGALHMTVTTGGSVSRVELYLGTVGPEAPAPITYVLVLSSPGVWSATGTAPSAAGTYTYSVGVFGRSGRRSLVNRGAWTIVVGGQGPAQAQPIPDDLVLIPPFSYGNPAPATFTAEGRTVHGSEVVSDARPDIKPSTVAQLYTQRLPRAGWTVAPGTIPAAGATSFTIVATQGTQVTVVEYSAAVLHVFYGNLPA